MADHAGHIAAIHALRARRRGGYQYDGGSGSSVVGQPRSYFGSPPAGGGEGASAAPSYADEGLAQQPLQQYLSGAAPGPAGGGMMDVGTTTAGDTVGQAPSPYYAPGPGNLSPDAWKSLQGLGYGPGTPSGPFYGQDPSINPPVPNPYNYPFPDAQILDPFLDPYGPEDLIPQPRPMQPPPEGPMLQPGFPQFVPSPDEYQFPPGPYAGQMRRMFG